MTRAQKKEYKRAKKKSDTKRLDEAKIILNDLLTNTGYDYKVYTLYSYLCFNLGQYQEAEHITKKLIEKNPEDAISNNLHGLVIAKLGRVQDGVIYLKKSIGLKKGKAVELYHDLAVVLIENGRLEEALEYIQKAREFSFVYNIKSQLIYEDLKRQIREKKVFEEWRV